MVCPSRYPAPVSVPCTCRLLNLIYLIIGYPYEYRSLATKHSNTGIGRKESFLAQHHAEQTISFAFFIFSIKLSTQSSPISFSRFRAMDSKVVRICWGGLSVVFDKACHLRAICSCEFGDLGVRIAQLATSLIHTVTKWIFQV